MLPSECYLKPRRIESQAIRRAAGLGFVTRRAVA